ncbi:MAG: GyrI-like domain-containing protein [Lachnospiraceae bacterium]|nr:GyrI-like domain-containing protein [Lachnospiraceae bacterium]
MSVKIVEIKQETWPKARLIGKKYEGAPNWGEWWANNWFEALEALPCLPINGDAYIGAVHIVNGMPEHWIGMFFSVDTEVPEGFEYVDIDPMEYAVCYLQDQDGSGDFYSMDTHNMCLEELKTQGLKRKEDDWCFERYNCPRFTTPDDDGNVILDYGISIEK